MMASMMTVWMMVMMPVVVMAMVMTVPMVVMTVWMMVPLVWMVVMAMMMIKRLRHWGHLHRHSLLLRINKGSLLLVYYWECHFVFLFVGT